MHTKTEVSGSGQTVFIRFDVTYSKNTKQLLILGNLLDF
jgi:hypothetical protein